MKTEGQLQGLSFLWQRSLRGNLFISLAGFAVLAALSPLVARFLHLDNIWYPLILFTSILFLLLISVNWGVLQGLQRFLPFGVSQAATYLVRLIFGALFVYAGWGIYGGLAAVTLSLAVVLPLTFVPLRDLPEAGNKKVAIEGMQAYAGLTLLALITLTSMANLDAILARHYLTAVEAGNYSALSVLGRIAYYAPLGIGIAMFPKTSELYDCGGNYRRPFYKAALLTLLIAGAIVLVYLFFPQAITGLLFGQKYPLVAPYLFEYGVAMVLLVAAFLLANYFLSLKRTSIVYSLLAVTILQIGLIAVYHAEISQLVHIMLASGVLCILVMLPPFFRRAS
jgi:O-antigen/teichoic acid export membrane protein